jgi:LPS-assembly protein
LQTSQVQLPRQVVLGYTPAPWLQTSMQVLRYQTLQIDPNNPISRPYFLEPQLNMLAYKPNVFKMDVSAIGSRFTHVDAPGCRVTAWCFTRSCRCPSCIRPSRSRPRSACT